LVSSSRRIALASLFGVLVFLVKGFLPAPTSDYLIIIEAFLVGLGYILLGRFGATYVELVNGLLLTAVKISFAPFSLLLALLFGIMVDGFCSAFKVKQGRDVIAKRLAAALVISTAVVGLVAYFTTVTVTHLIPDNATITMISVTILIFGTISGAVAGYLAARVWNRNLKARFYGTR
jgi:NhaP-type Na+/H+ and K+/H+ antiporter